MKNKKSSNERDEEDAEIQDNQTNGKRQKLTNIQDESQSNDENDDNDGGDDQLNTMLQINNEAKSLKRHPPAAKRDSKRLIVVLEHACLETIKVGSSYELLNCDRHKQQIIKYKKDPSQCRPDILHQCLLMLFDSPLNRASLLQVYVHTQKNVLIEINPQTRIPRTFDRFCGLMVQLLHKLSIRGSDTSQKLLKVIKNPITDHLPVGCAKYYTSFHTDTVMHVNEFVQAQADDRPTVVAIGAMAKGSINPDYADKSLSISNYPLSAAITCSKFCSAFEDKWKIF
jgi:rRNA small subunit pseudouridine methyltransferase Nep1